MSEWNPRYVCYARAHGNEPAAMLEADKAAYPGGCMAEFIVWVDAMWREWALEVGRVKRKGVPDLDVLFDEDHESFDAWLERRTADGRHSVGAGGSGGGAGHAAVRSRA